MNSQELIKALRRLKIETGSLACWGCGHEHNCGIHGCRVMREAADLIENQQNHIAALMQANDALRTRWIPVTERLPEIGEAVLVVANGQPRENATLVGAIELGEWYEGDWLIDAWPDWRNVRVTHWLPLPAGPEVE